MVVVPHKLWPADYLVSSNQVFDAGLFGDVSWIAVFVRFTLQTAKSASVGVGLLVSKLPVVSVWSSCEKYLLTVRDEIDDWLSLLALLCLVAGGYIFRCQAVCLLLLSELLGCVYVTSSRRGRRNLICGEGNIPSSYVCKNDWPFRWRNTLVAFSTSLRIEIMGGLRVPLFLVRKWAPVMLRTAKIFLQFDSLISGPQAVTEYRRIGLM